jgi:channel protein (hemolysin III family)
VTVLAYQRRRLGGVHDSADVLRSASRAPLVLVGGALYTVGALTYAFHWPNLFRAHVRLPRIFHVLVVAAAAAQRAVAFVVV